MSEIKLKSYTLKYNPDNPNDIFGIPDPNIAYKCGREDRATGFDYIHKIVMLTRAHPEALDLLKEYLEVFPEKINCKNKGDDKWTPLQLACMNSNTDSTEETVEFLLDNPDIKVNLQIYERTALYCTYAEFGRDSTERTFELLLDHPKIDINILDDFGMAVLHSACENNDMNDNEKAIGILVAHPKIDINLQDNMGRTALHWACIKSYLRRRTENTVDLLLKHPGININLQDDDGSTALHVACKYNQIKLVQIFLEH